MSAATTETIEQRMDRLRLECRVNETGEHTCQSDPEVEAAYAAWVADNRAGRPVAARCDYCDEPGCRWQNHGEARDDVAAWNAGTLPGVLFDHA